jgi:FG-GAP-like repeat/Secretion system C-terminal sorting domain/IPT/TIG domain/FG-GAP repeat
MKTARLLGVGILSTMLSAIMIAAPPKITSFSPTSGPVGIIVTIAGSDFNTTASNNVVFFGATGGTVLSASSTLLTVSVPVGASYAPMSVTDTTTGLTAYSSSPFIVTFPGGGSITPSSFANPIDFSTASNPNFVAIADIDGDGKPDLVITEETSGLVSIFRNTSTIGSISLANRVDFAEGGTPHNVHIGDIDGDGRPDLVIGTDSMISVFRNTSTSGSISLASRVDFETGYPTTGVAICDVDGDGKPDLVASTWTHGSIVVLCNTSTRGSISMASKAEFGRDSTWAPDQVAIADIDGDGTPDVVVVTSFFLPWSVPSISVLRNLSTSGSFSFANRVDHVIPTYIGSNPVGLRIADFDDDGKQDLIVASAGGDRIMVFRNTSTSGSISWLLQDSCLLPIGSNPYVTAVADVNGDGKPDLATNDGGSSVSMIRNMSTNVNMSFASPVSFGSGGEPEHFAIADIDGDGAPDVVMPHWSGSVSLLRNTVMPDAVPDIGSRIPTRFDLSQNYPNPFNPTTKIQFSIVHRQLTIVNVYDVLGREVATLVNEVKEPGTYTVRFSGSGLASGVYFYRLTAGSYLATHKMILMR